MAGRGRCWRCAVTLLCLVTILSSKQLCKSETTQESDTLNSSFIGYSKSSSILSMSFEYICHNVVEDNKLFVNCSHRGLSSVPMLPRECYSLDLSYNAIRKIQNNVFRDQNRLEVLDLSFNPIGSIDPNAFNDLAALRNLRLRETNLAYVSLANVAKLLSNLHSLKYLTITYNITKKIEHPNYCSCRTSPTIGRPVFASVLDYLEIDASLSPTMTSSETVSSNSSGWFWITKQLVLRMSPYCLLKEYTRECFSNWPRLKHLYIFFLNAPPEYSDTYFYKDVFNTTADIETLVFNHSDFHYKCSMISPFVPEEMMENISTAASHLRNLQILIVHKIAYYCSFFKFVDTDDFFRPLRNIRSLTSLDISNNNFCISSIGSFFPESLTTLIVDYNKIQFHMLVVCLLKNPQLLVLEALHQRMCRTDEALKGQIFSKNSVCFSANIERFIYSYSNIVVDVNTMRFSRLKYLDLSWNVKKEDRGLEKSFLDCSRSLVYLDLSGYGLHEIEKTATVHTHLSILKLRSNSLSQMVCVYSEGLRQFPNLTHIDLSDNKIQCLRRDIFTDMINLQILDLSQNHLDTFNISLKHLKQITSLNLSYNHVQQLMQETMDELDAVQTGVVTLDLTGNILRCDCSSQKFIQWIGNSRHYFVNKEQYVCDLSNKTLVSLKHFADIATELERKCTSYTVLITVCSILCAVGVSVIIGSVLYRYRWKLRYFYYMAKLHRRDISTGYQRIFDYDAFVSYSSEDQKIARDDAIEKLEGEHGLKLCIHERVEDFPPGQSIACNIARAVRSSRRTIFFLSPAFLASEWCIYEMNIARLEALYGNRDVILVVMLEKIRPEETPLEVMHMIQTYTFLEYPPGGENDDKTEFWESCRKCIQTV